MMKTISNSCHILTLILLIFLSNYSSAQFINPSWGKEYVVCEDKSLIEVSFAVNDKEKTQGLSDLAPEKMAQNQGLLFVYNDIQPRFFWMPNTFFNLDIIFINDKFEVIGIEENIKHYPSRKNENDIPRTKGYWAQYVLELHAFRAKSCGIKVLSKIKWQKHPNSLDLALKTLKKE